jgi:hypothetical protein
MVSQHNLKLVHVVALSHLLIDFKGILSLRSYKKNICLISMLVNNFSFTSHISLDFFVIFKAIEKDEVGTKAPIWFHLVSSFSC